MRDLGVGDWGGIREGVEGWGRFGMGKGTSGWVGGGNGKGRG